MKDRFPLFFKDLDLFAIGFELKFLCVPQGKKRQMITTDGPAGGRGSRIFSKRGEVGITAPKPYILIKASQNYYKHVVDIAISLAKQRSFLQFGSKRNVTS